MQLLQDKNRSKTGLQHVRLSIPDYNGLDNEQISWPR